jgi:hypothetical protein
MATVLIAPLGDSPIVVTAMVEALERHPDGPRTGIDVVEVLYPTGQGSQAINFGFDLIEEALRERCQVRGHDLGFPDANTEERCIEYLRALDPVLQGHVHDEVYVSAAGGRKSMAALTAVATQFHPQIRGLYHVLDKHERDPARRHFWTNDELLNESDGERRTKMLPPIADLTLVELPFQPLAQAADLRRYLGRGTEDESFRVAIDDDGRAFFERVFGAHRSSERLELRFSSAAYERFRGLNANVAERFWNCFRSMMEPAVLKGKVHGEFRAHGRTYHFYKAGRTAERPFFYTEPNDIVGWPHRRVDRVVVAGLSIHTSDERYDIEAEEWIRRGPFDDRCTPDDLPARPGILLVPLGESPMIATQTYVLLRERERIRIERVVLLYPGNDPPIRNGVRLIKELFEDPKLGEVRGGDAVPVKEVPIEGMQDVDSREACKRFGRALGGTIAQLQERYRDRPLHVSLSGGRKAMAALTYFGAQQAGLSRVWHTTISDPQFDKQVEDETTLDNLAGLKTTEKAARLFLQAYDASRRDKFTIFPVPVIPLNFTASREP